jgi:hypothetical protein
MLATPFSLSDQYGKTYDISFPGEKPSILVFADKRGAAQVEGWVRPLYEKYQDRVLIRGVAKLKGVPYLLRSIVAGLFRKMVRYSILLDWKCEICDSYRYAGQGKAYIVVVDQDGIIRHWHDGKATEREIEKCAAVIDSLM